MDTSNRHIIHLDMDALPVQLGLFDNREKTDRRQLTKAMDEINERYGSLTIKPALLKNSH